MKVTPSTLALVYAIGMAALFLVLNAPQIVPLRPAPPPPPPLSTPPPPLGQDFSHAPGQVDAA